MLRKIAFLMCLSNMYDTAGFICETLSHYYIEFHGATCVIPTTMTIKQLESFESH